MIPKSQAKEARDNRNKQLLDDAVASVESVIDAAICEYGEADAIVVPLLGCYELADNQWSDIEQRIRERYEGPKGGWLLEFSVSLKGSPLEHKYVKLT